MSRFLPPDPRRAGSDEFHIFRGLLFFGLLVVAIWLLVLARGVILPFFLAGLLAYVMSPLVTFLELRGLKRTTAVALLYVAVVLVVGGLAYWIHSIWWEEIPRLRYNWPLYLQQFKASAVHADALLRTEWPWVSEHVSLSRTVNQLLRRADSALDLTPSYYLPLIVTLGLNLILVPFVGFYFLKGGRAGFQVMLDACPGRWVEKFLSLLHKMDDVIGNYLRGVLMEAFLVGSCACVGLLLLGVDYAGILGGAALVFNLVPYLGPLAAGGLAVTAAFLQHGNLIAPAQVALFFLSLRLADDLIFQPTVMNRAVHLHPALVIFAFLAGHEIAGIWGLILAVPTVSIVKELGTLLLAWYRSETGRHTLPPALARAAAKPWVV